MGDIAWTAAELYPVVEGDRYRFCGVLLPAKRPAAHTGDQVMTPPTIQALGVTQEGSPTRWRATGQVEGLGWLEAWGTSLITALEALQTLAAQRVADADEGVEEDETR